MKPEQIRAAALEAIRSIAPESDTTVLRPDLPLRDQVDLDSIDWVNVVAAIHEHLRIDIPEADYGRLGTLDEIVTYIGARLKRRRTPRGKPMPAALAESRHLVGRRRVVVRPMRPDDKDRESEFVRGLSDETRYNRFMLTVRELSKEKLRYLTEVDQVRHVALVASRRTGGREVFLGVVRYIADARGESCEFAIAIGDAWQGTGLAGILMHRLIGAARAHGVATMEGLVLRTNGRMLKFTRQLGFRPEVDPEDNQTLRVVRSL